MATRHTILPAHGRALVSTDIHGNHDDFLALRRVFEALGPDARWVILGDGERLTLDPDHIVAVGPPTSRTLASGPDGLRVLIIGSQPGCYDPPDWLEGGGEE